MQETALIVGAGSGLSASLTRLFTSQGMKVALASRDTSKLVALCDETGARAIKCDARDATEVKRLFDQLKVEFVDLSVLVYNARVFALGPIVDLDPADVAENLEISAFGAFLVAQQAAKVMLARGGGTMLFTGATASVKANARSAPFAMGKFALRGLTQSLARELGPQGIHVCHFVMDGMFRTVPEPMGGETPDSTMEPDEIAKVYLGVIRQHRSTWTAEMDMRPWVEKY